MIVEVRHRGSRGMVVVRRRGGGGIPRMGSGDKLMSERNCDQGIWRHMLRLGERLDGMVALDCFLEA